MIKWQWLHNTVTVSCLEKEKEKKKEEKKAENFYVK